MTFNSNGITSLLVNQDVTIGIDNTTSEAQSLTDWFETHGKHINLPEYTPVTLALEFN